MRKIRRQLTTPGMLRKLVKAPGLFTFANGCLRRFPVVKKLPDSHLRYRAGRVESLALPVEMFDHGPLDNRAGLPPDIRTFAGRGAA